MVHLGPLASPRAIVSIIQHQRDEDFTGRGFRRDVSLHGTSYLAPVSQLTLNESFSPTVIDHAILAHFNSAGHI